MNIRVTEEQFNKILSEMSRSGYHRPDYDSVSLVNDPKVRSGKAWADKPSNFPVMRNGRVFYVSRSVAVSLYCYCQNSEGEWCVLANQRGPGAPNNRGLWNVPCGYLDYSENAAQAAAREAWEETGVKIPLNKIKMMGTNSNPGGKREEAQNVTIRHAAVLDGTTDQYPLSAANCEPGEVTDIQWIPLSQAANYQWAFGQGHKVIEQAKTSLNYENGEIHNDLPAKINSLKNELKGNPYAEQLFASILQDLKEYGML